MPTARPSPSHGEIPLLRAIGRASTAATRVLDPDVIPEATATALVRHLGARRADIWRIDGRRTTHLASAGGGDGAPVTLPAPVARVARGGLSQSLGGRELGEGAGVEWRRLLFALDAHHLEVHALMVDDRCLGCITVVDAAHGGAMQDARSIFAQQVASALDKASLHRSAQEAALSLRLQNRILADLTDEHEVPALRAAIHTLLDDALGSVSVALLPIDSLGRVTVPLAGAGSRVATGPEVTLVAPALDRLHGLRLDAPSSQACAGIGLVGIGDQPDTAVHCIRLRAGERDTGVLVLGVAESPGDTSRDRQITSLLAALAPATSVALENARLFARVERRASRLAAANDLARTITACSTAESLHDQLAQGVRDLLGLARTALYDGDLACLAESGRPSGRGTSSASHAPGERPLVSTAMHRRRPSVSERPDRTCHAVPLLAGDTILTVLYAEQTDAVTPEQESDDLALLRSACEHAAACLVALGAADQLERNYKDTIQALVQALEARDEYTASHSDAVAEWALEVGRRLGMSDDDLRDLELGAILHDIGKVAVPDGILNKAGRLTADEFEVMKRHTIIGERILQPIGFLAGVAPIVRHEHERWDGKGYPDGISGTDIPLASRIIFACDAYDAITSDRPYRAGQTHAFARRILVENAGTQFDPAVVATFVEMVDEWRSDRGLDVNAHPASGIEISNPLGPVAPKPATGTPARRAA